MANPFGDKAKSTSKSKFKSMTGKSGGGQKFDGEKMPTAGGDSGVGRLQKAKLAKK